MTAHSMYDSGLFTFSWFSQLQQPVLHRTVNMCLLGTPEYLIRLLCVVHMGCRCHHQPAQALPAVQAKQDNIAHSGHS